ncbi:hypothetical protein N7495_000549 [Penicillium taxi]|uniref:uncharacterized protein n=1 Tax=Penicillium taxi TaxID=168475 RepID=UPI002545A731|nr:uncharacterized protein N7495_000549 [Penicillium taxi]KAJ5907867.1 hypothetical protein N7495_000549 [Penicillium taxi]
MDRLKRYQETDENDDTVRILQAFLLHLPLEGKRNLERDIRKFELDSDVKKHMMSLVFHLLLPMRSRKTPVTTPLSPCPDVQADVEEQYSELIQAQKRLKVLKQECLLRDGNACTISQVRDRETVSADENIKFRCLTQCAHILRFSLSTWNSDAWARERSVVWVALQRCFPALDSLAVRFRHSDINDHRNNVTMETMLHVMFGEFSFSLMPIDGRVDEYSIKRWGEPNTLDYYLSTDITTVKFNNHGTRFDLPSPDLLKVHPIVAEIFHASGRADFITNILRDMDDEGIFAENVSSDLSEMLWASDLAYLGEGDYTCVFVPV